MKPSHEIRTRARSSKCTSLRFMPGPMLSHQLLLTLLLTAQLAGAANQSCAAAASKHPAASVACDNADQVQEMLTRPWTPNSTSHVELLLQTAAAFPGLYGAAVAFTPAAIKKYNITREPLFSPYCHALPNSTFAEGLQNIQCIDIGDLQAGGYNYTDGSLPQTGWFTMVANRTGNALSTPIFSGVYFDKGGGEIWMDTFSVPVPGPDGKLAAVATADIREQPPAGDAGAAASPAALSSPPPPALPRSGSVCCLGSALRLVLMASLVLFIISK